VLGHFRGAPSRGAVAGWKPVVLNAGHALRSHVVTAVQPLGPSEILKFFACFAAFAVIQIGEMGKFSDFPMPSTSPSSTGRISGLPTNIIEYINLCWKAQ
jgi:hypothetical protein